MLGGTILFILVLGLAVKSNQGEKNILSGIVPGPTATPNLKTIKIGNISINVTVADNDATRAKGLGGVTNLASNQGMLFVFPSKNISPEMARFWMKDMKIPLDFIWIANGKVVEITANVPAPAQNTPDNQLLIYQPNENVDFVLEVNALFSSKNNIKVGDNITGL